MDSQLEAPFSVHVSLELSGGSWAASLSAQRRRLIHIVGAGARFLQSAELLVLSLGSEGVRLLQNEGYKWSCDLHGCSVVGCGSARRVDYTKSPEMCWQGQEVSV